VGVSHKRAHLKEEDFPGHNILINTELIKRRRCKRFNREKEVKSLIHGSS
jgi:hypothetical protein